MASGIFSASLGVGQCLGPVYGAAMYKRIGFAWTTDTIAIATLVFGVVYFFVASGA